GSQRLADVPSQVARSGRKNWSYTRSAPHAPGSGNWSEGASQIVAKENRSHLQQYAGARVRVRVSQLIDNHSRISKKGDLVESRYDPNGTSEGRRPEASDGHCRASRVEQ